MKEKVGLYGGSFNPIHNGHIDIAKTIKENFKLDKIIFIPNNISPLKASDLLEDKIHRLNMLKLAVENEKDFLISTYEYELKGKSYTINTVNQFTKKNPSTQYLLILGADSFENFSSWNSYLDILKSIDIVVYPRNNLETVELIKQFIRIKSFAFQKDESSTLEMEIYNTINNHKLYFPKFNLINISATIIREAIKNKQNLETFLPVKVIEYISNNKLFP